jgi:hypothetical protein
MVVSPRARPEYETQPTPLVYGGGFLNKTLVFETLVNLDREGRACPGLARAWSAATDGRTWTFELRPGARFHSGAPCDAEAGPVRDRSSTERNLRSGAPRRPATSAPSLDLSPCLRGNA